MDCAQIAFLQHFRSRVLSRECCFFPTQNRQQNLSQASGQQNRAQRCLSEHTQSRTADPDTDGEQSDARGDSAMVTYAPNRESDFRDNKDTAGMKGENSTREVRHQSGPTFKGQSGVYSRQESHPSVVRLRKTWTLH